MSTERILIHGDTASRMATTPAQGQIGSDDALKTVVLGDGSTSGGILMAREDQKNNGSLGYTSQVQTDDYTIVGADKGKLIVADKATAIVFALTAAALLGNKFSVIIKNHGAGDLTVTPNGSEEVDGESSLVLSQGTSVILSCDGAGFRTALKQEAAVSDASGIAFDNTEAELEGDPDTVQTALDALAARPVGGGGGSDLSTALLSLALSEVNSAPVALGTLVADSFGDLSLVDVTGASGLDSGTSGILKPQSTLGSDAVPVMTSGTTSGVTVTASSETTLAGWKCFDGVINNISANIWQVENPVSPVVLQVDFGSGNAKRIGQYKLAPRITDGTTYVATAWTLEGSNNNSDWNVLDSRSGITSGWTNATLRSFVVPAPSVYRYYRLRFTTFASSSYFLVAEAELVVSTVSDMIVRSEVMPSAAMPEKMMVVGKVFAPGGLTLNTDLAFEVSRDNGDTWSDAPVSQIFTIDGVAVVQSGWIDVSAHGAVNEPAWRVTSDNGASFSLEGVSIPFG